MFQAIKRTLCTPILVKHCFRTKFLFPFSLDHGAAYLIRLIHLAAILKTGLQDISKKPSLSYVVGMNEKWVNFFTFAQLKASSYVYYAQLSKELSNAELYTIL